MSFVFLRVPVLEGVLASIKILSSDSTFESVRDWMVDCSLALMTSKSCVRSVKISSVSCRIPVSAHPDQQTNKHRTYSCFRAQGDRGLHPFQVVGMSLAGGGFR